MDTQVRLNPKSEFKIKTKDFDQKASSEKTANTSSLSDLTELVRLLKSKKYSINEICNFIFIKVTSMFLNQYNSFPLFDSFETIINTTFQSSSITLEEQERELLKKISKHDWSKIRPLILGQLFQIISNDDRFEHGSYYTDETLILKIIEPVILQPFNKELEKLDLINPNSETDLNEHKEQYIELLEKLQNFRILDPACGSGNFLYFAFINVKKLELKILSKISELSDDLRPFKSRITLANFYGIDTDKRATCLANMVLWIAIIQMNQISKYSFNQLSLKILPNIETRDALLDLNNQKPRIAEWPEVDAIIGNPPFLGASKISRILGDEYLNYLKTIYSNYANVKGYVDLYSFWFIQSLRMAKKNHDVRIGLVSSKSIVNPDNQLASLQSMVESHSIDLMVAYKNINWHDQGAQVRVAVTCWWRRGDREQSALYEDEHSIGKYVDFINAELSSNSFNITKLEERTGYRSELGEGIKSYDNGGFQIDSTTRFEYISEDDNNNEVIRRYITGADIGKNVIKENPNYIIDFTGLSIENIQEFHLPLRHVLTRVKPYRDSLNYEKIKTDWWLYERSRTKFFTRIRKNTRILVTSKVMERRQFVFYPSHYAFSNGVIMFRLDRWFQFGILQSTLHVTWMNETGSRIGVGDTNVYNITHGYGKFPWPELNVADTINLSKIGKKVHEFREGYCKENNLSRNDFSLLPPPKYLVLMQELDNLVLKIYGIDPNSSQAKIIEFLYKLRKKRAELEEVVTPYDIINVMPDAD